MKMICLFCVIAGLVAAKSTADGPSLKAVEAHGNDINHPSRASQVKLRASHNRQQDDSLSKGASLRKENPIEEVLSDAEKQDQKAAEKSQEAADKVSKEQMKEAQAAAAEPGPLEQVGEAVADVVQDAEDALHAPSGITAESKGQKTEETSRPKVAMKKHQEGPTVADAVASPSAAPAASPAAGIQGPILGTKASRELQAQGFSGEFVEHEDDKTMTGDWGREFGPSSNHREVKVICKDHPGNEWCSLHGYYKEQKVRSGACEQSVLVVLAAQFLAQVLW